MKAKRKLSKAFGVDEYGFPDIPRKASNVKISRIINSEARGGCAYCFPHGVDLNNAHFIKYQRNWKKYRKFQWK